MLPVVSENIKVANQIIIYSFVMSFTTLILPLTVELSIYYWAGSIILNILFLKEAFALRNRIMSKLTEILPMKLFNYSITYLALLFLLIGIDPLIS